MGENKEQQRLDIDIDQNVIELQSDYVLLRKIIRKFLKNAPEHHSDQGHRVELSFKNNRIVRVAIPENFT